MLIFIRANPTYWSIVSLPFRSFMTASVSSRADPAKIAVD